MTQNSPSHITKPRVLVFDSGVGGLSILDEIHQAAPDCELIFASDNAAYPYGTKNEADLIERVCKVVKALADRYNPCLLVVACNSASTLALPQLRKQFTFPIVGVVPAIKPAAEVSQTKVIGLLATPGTVKRAYTHQLIEDFAQDCQVVLKGTGQMVDLAEQKLRGQAICNDSLAEILEPLFQISELDTIILACTHFPLLQAECQALAPRDIHWVDSGSAIARRVQFLLGQLYGNTTEHQHKHVSTETKASQYQNQACFTAHDEALEQLKPALASFHIQEFDVLELPFNG